MERKPTRRREVGRGERVLAGVWRLRLPLPWPGVPHCNAWALAAGDGIVLVDCGMHEPGSLEQLERALDNCGLRLEHVRALVCTHGHADHCGQAATVAARAGCPVWMHPDRAHAFAVADAPEARLARRINVARESGVPEEPLRRWVQEHREDPSGVAQPLRVDRDLVPGVTIDSDLGAWEVVETPGHAPSHVVLFQPRRRLLLSGDHLLGRVSLYFDFGYTPDPVGEFLDSLERVARLDARLCLAGHARPFADVAAHIEANRALVAARLQAVRALLAGGPRTAYEVGRGVYGDAWNPVSAAWLLTKTLCWLRHLEVTGAARRFEPAAPDDPERWEGVS